MFSQFFKKQKAIKLLNENKQKNIKDAIFNDDVRKAFFDFVKLNKNENVLLIGGLSVGVFSQARNTQNIDILVLSEKDIDSVFENVKSKFKRTRTHAFEHKATGVEIEVLTPSFIKYPDSIFKKAIDAAIVQDVDGREIKIVSPKFLIALKLKRASLAINKSHMDKYDISNLTDIYGKFDFSDLDLTDDEIETYKELTRN